MVSNSDYLDPDGFNGDIRPDKYPLETLCGNCGHSYGEHRTTDSNCPTYVFWGTSNRRQHGGFETAGTKFIEPLCACGHHSEDHSSDPSGMAPSRCWHADTYDSLDYPATGACNCRDYNPVPA
jgi:hypothetical protein